MRRTMGNQRGGRCSPSSEGGDRQRGRSGGAAREEGENVLRGSVQTKKRPGTIVWTWGTLGKRRPAVGQSEAVAIPCRSCTRQRRRSTNCEQTKGNIGAWDSGETKRGSMGVGRGLYRSWRGGETADLQQLAGLETAGPLMGIRASNPVVLMEEIGGQRLLKVLPLIGRGEEEDWVRQRGLRRQQRCLGQAGAARGGRRVLPHGALRQGERGGEREKRRGARGCWIKIKRLGLKDTPSGYIKWKRIC